MEAIENLAQQEYKEGWVTDIEMETTPPGLNEDIIRFISSKKNEPEFLLEWRLKAYNHWLKLKEHKWQFMEHPAINYQDIKYYAAPKNTPKYNSLEEVDLTLIHI